MNQVFKRPTDEFGLGNLFIVLTVIADSCNKLHDNVYDYELSNCVILNGFTRVSYEGEPPHRPLFINYHTVNFVHPKIRDIVSPTAHMQGLIEKHEHIIRDVTAAVSIRRGSYCADSRQYKDARGDKQNHYFCSDAGLEKFKNIIRLSKGRVFVSSDSQSTIRQLREEFGEKLSVFEMSYAITCTHDQTCSNIEDLQNVYLKWFLLSKCPVLYLTAGNKDLTGFSTYAYIAAIYGRKPFHFVFNEE